MYGFSAFAMCTVQIPMVVRHFFGRKGYASIYSFVQSAATLFQAFVTTFFGVIYDRTKSYANALIAAIIFLVVAYIMYALVHTTGKNLYDRGNPGA
jgi:cyanate permease